MKTRLKLNYLAFANLIEELIIHWLSLISASTHLRPAHFHHPF
jgi:hypothetical protein